MGTSRAAIKVGGRREVCAVLAVHGDVNPQGFQAQCPCSSRGNQAKKSWTRAPVVLDEKEHLPVHRQHLVRGFSCLGSWKLSCGAERELLTCWGRAGRALVF